MCEVAGQSAGRHADTLVWNHFINKAPVAAATDRSDLCRYVRCREMSHQVQGSAALASIEWFEAH